VVPLADYRKLGRNPEAEKGKEGEKGTEAELGQKKGEKKRTFGNYRELNLWIATLANSYRGIEENSEVLKTDLDKETCDPFHLRLEILKEIYNLGNCMLYFRSDDAKEVQILIREYMRNHEEVQSLKRESDSNEKTKEGD
jgi:hypothetical protein